MHHKILELAQILDAPQKHKIQHRLYPAPGLGCFFAAAIELQIPESVDPQKAGLKQAWLSL